MKATSKAQKFDDLVGRLVTVVLRTAWGTEGASDEDIEGYVVGFETAGSERFMLIESRKSERFHFVRLSAVTHIELFKE